MVRVLRSCRKGQRKKSGMMKTRTGFTHGFRDPQYKYKYKYIYIHMYIVWGFVRFRRSFMGGFKSRGSEISLVL